MLAKEESLGQGFNLTHYLKARQVAIGLTRQFAYSLQVGVRESEAHQQLQLLMEQEGIEKLWHPTKIRFGRNTLCSFRDPSFEDEKLAMGDIFYLDIGPVILGHEADYGESFIQGSAPDALVLASRDLFKSSEKKWLEDGLTGMELYQYAQNEARLMGYELEMRSSGHRLGDFPHAIHHKGKLLDWRQTPHRGVWILEIHLVDKTRERAAFFEDILGLESLTVQGV
jgi:hypothetical protein